VGSAGFGHDASAPDVYAAAMLPLRILRFVNRAYPFVAFGAYGIAFVLAFVCMFTFPLGALTLVVMGVLSLAFVALGSDALKGLERVLSRRALHRGRCPACRMGPVQSVESGWCCRGCTAAFEGDGTQRAVETPEEPAQASEDAAAVSVA
jgi:ribosomal protein L37AE/L43A